MKGEGFGDAPAESVVRPSFTRRDHFGGIDILILFLSFEEARSLLRRDSMPVALGLIRARLASYRFESR